MIGRVLTRAAVSLATLAGVTGAAAFAYGALIERKRFTLRRVTVPVLAAGAEPIRVLHISDIHMAPWQRAKQEWLRGLAAERPDLIVDTGDNLGHVRGFSGIREALAPFAGVPGVFVNGSNDYWGPVFRSPLRYFVGASTHQEEAPALDIAEMNSWFRDRLGWADLNNRAAQLTVKGTRIEFFGVDDPHRYLDRLDKLTGAIDELRGEDDDSDDAPWPDSLDDGEAEGRRSTLTVGVAHAPYQRVLNSFVNHGAQVVFAGHTHGGQVCLPGYGALITNCDIPRRQVKGLSLWRYSLKSAFLHVSAGIGTSIYAPYRFFCPPEATLLELVPTNRA